MALREDLAKKNKRNNLFLLLVGLLILVGIGIGVGVHQHHVAAEKQAQTFAQTHFNPQVKIDGVKVGQLTVAAATAKVKRQAKNEVRLEEGKLVYHHQDKALTPSKAEIAAIFKKQHTNQISNLPHAYTSKNLRIAKNKLTNLKAANLTYQLNGHQIKLSAKELLNNVSYQNQHYQFRDTAKLTKKLNQIDRKFSTLHQSYHFVVPSGNKVKGKTITVKNKTYGWGVYVKKVKGLILHAFQTGARSVNGADAIYGLGYSTYAHGYGLPNHEIGNTYAVVSLKKQEVWLIKKGKLKVHLTDVVTGTMEGDKTDQTPRGVWYIHYKQSPSVLRGNNDDGSSYASPVKYWMPFTLSGCGFHDASWRTDWSKKAYLKGGSHGCVNVKPTEIKSVWHNMSKNEPVVIYE